MDEKDPVITDLYYNSNINKSGIKQELIDLYKTAKKIKITDDKFTSIKFSKKEKKDNQPEQRFVFYNPPMGPLPPGSKCSFKGCSKKGSKTKKVYHVKDCRTPTSDYLIMSKEGLKENKEKVIKFLNKKFKDKNTEQLEKIKKIVLSGKSPIKYHSIFPKRGVKDEKDPLKNRRTAFENTITISYSVPVPETSKYSKEGNFNIILRISKNYSFYITGAPYEINATSFKNLPETLIKEVKKYIVFNEKNDHIKRIESQYVIDEYSWITVLHGKYNIIKDKNYELNMNVLDEIFNKNKIKGYTVFNYKFKENASFVSFHISYKGFNAYVEIKKRGNVKIMISYGNSSQTEYGIYFPNLTKMEKEIPKINKKLLKEISLLLKPIFLENKQRLLKKKTEKIFDEDKIYNIITPLGYKGQTLLQPKICNTINKSRPVLYSFKGKCPGENEYVDEQGLHWSRVKSKTFNKFDIYEPCCKKITGNYNNNLTFNDKKKDINTKIKGLNIKRKDIDHYIKDSDGNKKIFLRRLVYGFPNNLRETRSTEELSDLFEDKTKKLENTLKNFSKYKVKDMDSPEVYGIEIKNGVYIDNKTATYKPGTQDKSKLGNGDKIRESRVFKGLKQLLTEDKNGSIEYIINHYFN